MKKDVLKLGVKILILLGLFLIGYYFLILGPRLAMSEKAAQLEKKISQHYFNLLQNRLTFVELTRLDPDSAAFNLEKSNLVGTLEKTKKEGLELVKKENNIPKVDNKLSNEFPLLLTDTENFYKEQEELLKKVFETKSYEKGVEILKTDDAIKLLTKQTNLILKYQYWLEKVNDQQERFKLYFGIPIGL